jgi:uncharacterized protein (DUF111 family)
MKRDRDRTPRGGVSIRVSVRDVEVQHQSDNRGDVVLKRRHDRHHHHHLSTSSEVYSPLICDF